MRAIACLCAVLVCPSFAQSPLSFEVATVKLHPPGPEGSATMQTGGPGTSDPTRITIVNRTLHRLLIEAYVLKGYQLQDPPALDQNRYDVTAVVPAGATEEDARVMMQNLLIERLQLKVRREHQVRQVWGLLIAKGGPKFRPSAETAAASAPETPAPGKPQIDRDGFPIMPVDLKPGIYRTTNTSGALKITVAKQTMAQFVSSLFGQTDHPIMDLTGLEGKYDFSVIFNAHWKSDLANMLSDAPGLPPEPLTGGAPTIFDAVEKQLGLKLEPRKMPADLVIVDSGQKVPVDN